MRYRKSIWDGGHQSSIKVLKYIFNYGHYMAQNTSTSQSHLINVWWPSMCQSDNGDDTVLAAL